MAGIVAAAAAPALFTKGGVGENNRDTAGLSVMLEQVHTGGFWPALSRLWEHPGLQAGSFSAETEALDVSLTAATVVAGGERVRGEGLPDMQSEDRVDGDGAIYGMGSGRNNGDGMGSDLDRGTSAARITYYGLEDGYGPEDIMANGQPFDPFAFTAATNHWPLSTRLRVTANGGVVEVVVTDRCGACDVDLSYGAFGALAPHSRGVLYGIVEVIE